MIPLHLLCRFSHCLLNWSIAAAGIGTGCNLSFAIWHFWINLQPNATWRQRREKFASHPVLDVIHWASLRSVWPTRRISWMAEQTLHKCLHKCLRMSIRRTRRVNGLLCMLHLIKHQWPAWYKASRTECFHSSCLRLQLSPLPSAEGGTPIQKSHRLSKWAGTELV